MKDSKNTSAECAVVKERPILFSGAMVRAILAGRKTQTRRVMKDAPLGAAAYCLGVYKGVWGIHEDVNRDEGVHRFKCPYGVPGDRLWVRETWAPSKALDDVPTMRLASGFPCEYRAGGTSIDGLERLVERGGWRPSIFMPRKASRILLEVTEVRVERLQGISEADAMAEGVERIELGPFQVAGLPVHPMTSSYKEAFEKLWETINGKRAPWASNPWVWVVGFKRVEVRNEDH